FIFGLARNTRLTRAIGAELAEARHESQGTGQPARRFKELIWSTRKSWSRTRRVIAKAEWTKGEANPRFIVTSLTVADGDCRRLYEQIYCARGEMENRIKECQMDLFADRTSTGTMTANQSVVCLDGLRSRRQPAPDRPTGDRLGRRHTTPPDIAAGAAASSLACRNPLLLHIEPRTRLRRTRQHNWPTSTPVPATTPLFGTKSAACPGQCEISGLVVVGDLIGAGVAQEQAVGETPNLAACLQALAEPNAVVIADSTRRLLGNLVELSSDPKDPAKDSS
ncbi:MAG TPA: transposase, partial [Xanthobacteraceae bacterium]|nr:transposase [Xanthobacteraceae bacterium]